MRFQRRHLLPWPDRRTYAILSTLFRDSYEAECCQLSVTASVPMDCVFWPEDDGWTGVCEELSVTARGNNFQQAKMEMEAELQTYIESFLPRRKIAA